MPIRRMKPRPHTTLVSVLLTLLVLAVGCGGGTQADDQPAAVDGSLAPGQFEAIPKPDAAQPFDDPVAGADSTIQSFRVTGLTPPQVLSFYDIQMPRAGWEPATPPSQVGAEEWRGEWTRQNEILQVSATPDTDDGDDDVVSQLDLVLRTS